MADGIFSTVTVLDASSVMDLDSMDELLLECCWFATADRSQFLPNTPSISSSLFEPYTFGWSVPEMNGNSSSIPQPNNDQNHSSGRGSVWTMNQKTIDDSRCLNDKGLMGNDELQKPRSVSSRPFPGSSSVIERLMMAVKYLKEFVRDKDVLIQVWVPVNTEGRMVLTTNDLPFSVNGDCSRLAKYRDISMSYQFSAEKDSTDLVGLPSRVFIRKIPEWTPDVTFFRSDEYPRVTYAQQCDVRGTLALPVFERGNSSCLAVVEVVRTSRQIKYVQELESVCKALEAVNLRSSDALGAPNSNLSDCFSHGEDEFFVLEEIHSVLRFACETHRLPLAQTWAPCVQQGREGCRHSDENYGCCVSTVNHACFVSDPNIGPFHEACSEYHLLKGQGVVGEAFTTHKPCFSSDVRLYGNTAYPLSHHARMFNLSAAAAIRLRSLHASNPDFVLEFFFPVTCTDLEEQRIILSSLLIIVQHSTRSLRFVTEKEVEEEGRACIIAGVGSNIKPTIQEIPPLQQGNNYFVLVGEDSGRKNVGENSPRLKRNKQDSSLKEAVKGDEYFNFGEGSSLAVGMGKTGEKRRTKAEKAITLQVLRQYFAGSLKDAAKSIGVGPTTLKRICRRHGIKRWPSRKIKKVGHSLQKLQRVIDSVEGGSGTFQIGSLYSNFPEIASQTLSRKSSFVASKMSDRPKTSAVQRERSTANLQGAAASKSASFSFSQGSSSSLCCSSRSLQFPPSGHDTGNKDPKAGENSGDGELKRVKSEAELHVPRQAGMYIPRSQSQRTLSEHGGHEISLRKAKDSGKTSEENDSLRVKVTYGDENIRLKMDKNQGFRDLLDGICRRFQIRDTSKIDLKYLDDDSEWVLLTCDADLEECIDVYKQSESLNQTIKLCLQLSRARNSLGSYDRSQLQ